MAGVTGKCEADMCYEERVFFRLMSGIQSSITAAVLPSLNAPTANACIAI
jgi:hypothetical protein